MVQRTVTIDLDVSVSLENDTWLKTRLTSKLKHLNIDGLSKCPRLFFYAD